MKKSSNSKDSKFDEAVEYYKEKQEELHKKQYDKGHTDGQIFVLEKRICVECLKDIASAKESRDSNSMYHFQTFWWDVDSNEMKDLMNDHASEGESFLDGLFSGIHDTWKLIKAKM